MECWSEIRNPNSIPEKNVTNTSLHRRQWSLLNRKKWTLRQLLRDVAKALNICESCNWFLRYKEFHFVRIFPLWLCNNSPLPHGWTFAPSLKLIPDSLCHQIFLPCWIRNYPSWGRSSRTWTIFHGELMDYVTWAGENHWAVSSVIHMT